MKIRPVGAKFMHVGRTNMTTLTDAIRDFANAPKNRKFVTNHKDGNTYGKQFYACMRHLKARR